MSIKWNKVTNKDFPELKDLRRIIGNNDARAGLLILWDEDGSPAALRYIRKSGSTKETTKLMDKIYEWLEIS